MSEEEASCNSGSNLCKRLTEPMDIMIRDFKNPWNLYFLFLCDEETTTNWCRANGLLASSITCPVKAKAEVRKVPK